MKKIVGLILSLTIIAAVCAGVLAYVNILTLEPIEKATAEKTVKAAKEVMPSGVVTVEKSSFGFLGKDSKGDIIGYAVEGKDSGGYGGDIILMHDYISIESHTLEALERVIPKLKKLGYRFVTVTELIGN